MKIKVVLIALILAASTSSISVKATDNMHSAQAMFIYNFLRHINWPEETTTGPNFIIGVYGNSPVYTQLLQYAKNRKVGVKSIVVRKISSPQEAANCQLVFVPSSHSGKLSSLRSQLGNRSVLLIGDRAGANKSGSTVEFLVQNNKLKFRIDENRAKQQNLVVSATLLKMGI